MMDENVGISQDVSRIEGSVGSYQVYQQNGEECGEQGGEE
jgi:hypothetical protein